MSCVSVYPSLKPCILVFTFSCITHFYIKFLQNTQRPNDQAIWANILQNSPRSLPTTEEAAVQQLLVGGWAYLAPGGTLNRILAKYCDVLAIDPKIYEKLYTTFAVRKGQMQR